MKKDFDELKMQSRALDSELKATQKVSQDRYKELTMIKEILSKAQPELKRLREESATLKTTREELASKQNELRALEKREKDLKNEVTRVQRLSTDRESEIKLLNNRLAAEKAACAKLEDEKRILGRDYRRSEAEKIEISAKAEKADRELEAVRSELSTLRPEVKQLEDRVAKLKKEKDLAREDADLKIQQYNNAQSLLTSMRDQNTELTVQLKEATTQNESLEEELAEVQKHLSERTREGETMRRMLADVDERANAKLLEMRNRLELAVEERDRIEDDSSTLARKRAREAEELKSKVRELEREVKALSNEKDDLEAREREWRHGRVELEQYKENTMGEIEELRSTMSSLRSALDASEQQGREAEKQKADLRKLLDESKGRYERIHKELKTVQSKFNIGSGSNIASSGRSSIDSTRSGLNNSPAKGSPGGPKDTRDIEHLKGVFLDFLVLNDPKHKVALAPVLGKLLGFNE
jgi:chromosome segregation ATPase